MKTEWVRVCVRPEQSFTRAILEIYMADGGSLGEVITALRKQKQFRIIQVMMVIFSSDSYCRNAQDSKELTFCL